MTISETMLLTYVLVFFRMAGLLAFNPIFSQGNIPAQFRIGLMLGMTLLVAPTAGQGYQPPVTDAAFVWAALCELTLGLAVGFIFQCFYYMLFFVGDVADQGFGLSMAKAFDPETNIQSSITGRLLQFIFIAYFFVTNGHLVFLQIAASSYEFVGIGAENFFENGPAFLLTLFVQVFSLSMQLLAPFLVATVTLEAATGILLKLIPQINVFVVHFQLKILFGFLLLILYAKPVSNFIMNYQTIMLQQIQKLLQAL